MTPHVARSLRVVRECLADVRAGEGIAEGQREVEARRSPAQDLDAVAGCAKGAVDWQVKGLAGAARTTSEPRRYPPLEVEAECHHGQAVCGFVERVGAEEGRREKPADGPLISKEDGLDIHRLHCSNTATVFWGINMHRVHHQAQLSGAQAEAPGAFRKPGAGYGSSFSPPPSARW